MYTKVLKDELGKILETIQTYAQGYVPKILYTFVDKRISHRLFEKDNGSGYINPGPGTTIDAGLVES